MLYNQVSNFQYIRESVSLIFFFFFKLIWICGWVDWSNLAAAAAEDWIIILHSIDCISVWSSCYAMLCYAKSLQSCPTLCNPIDGSPPGSPVPGILQARTLDWVAISFSNAWKWKEKVKLLSRVRLLATPRTAAYQAPPSMGFSRQEYWSGVPLVNLVSCYWVTSKFFDHTTIKILYSISELYLHLFCLDTFWSVFIHIDKNL